MPEKVSLQLGHLHDQVSNRSLFPLSLSFPKKFVYLSTKNNLSSFEGERGWSLGDCSVLSPAHITISWEPFATSFGKPTSLDHCQVLKSSFFLSVIDLLLINDKYFLCKFNFFRQLKLNKVDFNEVLNALESAQLSLNSLQLVACFGILDLGRWTSTNTKKLRWYERLFCGSLSRLCPALENLELYYCTSGSATASSPVRLPHLTSVTIYRLEKGCRFGIKEYDTFVP